ncbi:hypothetical protein B5M09_010892 [Aphanomyces astaci]|uniref:Uncharacterized protein n=1 Tax=Aphanomyces astaci TaxID=112090 RepID=A0A3R7YFE7_APHAT|nr:hypothetical protein AaE_013034 [Aphanomyces astaci]RQM19047.1 hypothetical protein B5M09_010892 [Aphanomyces astaci]
MSAAPYHHQAQCTSDVWSLSCPSLEDDTAYALALAAQFEAEDSDALAMASADAALAHDLAAASSAGSYRSSHGTFSFDDGDSDRDVAQALINSRGSATFDEWAKEYQVEPTPLINEDAASMALAKALADQFDHEIAIELTTQDIDEGDDATDVADHRWETADLNDEPTPDDTSAAADTPVVRSRNRRVSWFAQSSKSYMRKGVRIALD